MGTLSYGRDDVCYSLGFVQVNLAPHDIPLLLSRYQMVTDNVWAMETECLKVKLVRLAVKDGDTAAMHYRCYGSCNLISSQVPVVNYLLNLCLL